MRNFTDADGTEWTATTVEETGADYKGRFYLVLTPTAGGAAHELRDVRWNRQRTAQRTLETMSVVELRRRLKSAVGRGTPVGAE